MKATGDRSDGHRLSSKCLKLKAYCFLCTPAGGISANRSSVNLAGVTYIGNSAKDGGKENEKYIVKYLWRGLGMEGAGYK